MTDTNEFRYDAVVVGGGPAGMAAAAILGEAGRKVALLEKERVDRYKVGESLIPFCWFPLERLGLVDAVDRSAFNVAKHSVQFASIDGRVSKPYYFFDHTDHPCAKTWQVVREDFDKLLLENAISKGVDYFPYTQAKALLTGANGQVAGVRATNRDGEPLEFEAQVTIDASGRDTFSQTQNGWRIPDQKLRKHAIWTYYEGALRDEGVDEGTTTIAYLPEKGWFWYIPLPNDRVSVGVVAEKDYLFRKPTSSSQAIFEREAKVQQWIAERLAPGRRIDDFRITSDFSYRSKHCAKDGLVLVGDAYAFLDPVFSSGVYFALLSGVLGGDAVEAALKSGDTSAASFADYGTEFRRHIEPMRRLVYAFYDDDFNFATFLKQYPHFRGDLTDCLIGDLKRDFDPFFDAVREFADVPEPLPHGGPLVS